MGTLPDTELFSFVGTKRDGLRIVNALQIMVNMLAALDEPTEETRETLDAVVESLKQ